MGADIRLITVSHRNTPEKARIMAKILQMAGRTDIPIGVGPLTDARMPLLSGFVAGFDMDHYDGCVEPDGLALLERTLVEFPDCTLLGLSPACTLARVGEEVDVSGVKLVQMAGMVEKGYPEPGALPMEWNVSKDVPGFRRVLEREWDVRLVPLDVSGLVIEGEDFAALKASRNWAARAIMGCYEAWGSRHSRWADGRSSLLFDLVAAAVALHPEKAVTKKGPMVVTDDGRTLLEAQGREVSYVVGYPEGEIVSELLREVGA